MAKRWNRMETWLAMGVVGMSGLLVAILGLPLYMSATAPSLHPEPQNAPSVAGSEPGPTWAEAVARGQQITRAVLAEQNLPGLSVAVGVNGEIVWAEGFGWADIERRTPITPDTRFSIGTASTVLTSAAAGVLLEKQQLALDEEIQTYVPDFPGKQWPMTLRQVMGHVAGLISDSGDEGPLFSRHCERPADALPHFANASLLFQPGTRYRNSNYGWILVSAAIEEASGKPFLSFMREEIFDPLGMLDTRPILPVGAGAERATSYFPRFGGDPRYGLHLLRDINLTCYAGASVFMSTPSDLVRFGMAINGGKLLKPGTVQELQTSLQLASGEESGYGLGWDVGTIPLAGEDARTAGHDGEVLGGMVASLLTLPDHGIAVAVTSNISYTDTGALAVSIAEAFAEADADVRR